MKRKPTKQARALAKYSQLWLSAEEWQRPIPIIEDEEGGLVALPQLSITSKVVAWIVDRRPPPG